MGAAARRTLAAYAEALVPPGGALPGAEGVSGVAVVEPVAGLVAGFPPRIRALIRLVLGLWEWSPFPRRFSRMPLARRTARIERLQRSRWGPVRDLALLPKTLVSLGYARAPEVQRAVGCEPSCAAAGGEAPAGRRLEPEELRAPAEVERCDVVVVGSGAGGAAAARVLAESGLDVIVVEEGPYHDARSYSTDPIESLPMLYRDGGLTVCEGRPAIPMPVGRCVGGTTVINSGTCLRTPGDVLARWRDELGIPWAADLDAEFEGLERDLRVAAVDPERAGRNAQLCRAGAEAIGASNEPIRRNAGDVVCCGTCPSGCAIDAKQATHVSELPRAVAAGARVRANARVEGVLTRGGRAVGVRCAVDGRPYAVSARAVVMAAGALGTPALLLRERLARGSGHLGRHLHIHPACWVGARFDEEVRGWDGVMQSWHVDEWRDRHLFLEATFTPLAFGAHWLGGSGREFKERIERYDRMAIIGVHLSDRSEGRVRPDGRVRYRLSSEDAATLRFGIARAAQIHFAAGAREVYPQVGALRALAPGEERLVEHGRFRPHELRLEAFHPMGTARMGADPRWAVVAPTGEAHDVPGLYVVDASILPSSLGVNPMLTIMACARRIARGMAERLNGQSGASATGAGATAAG